MNGVQVSIDAVGEKHDEIRRLRCFDKAIEGINLIDKYRKQYGKKVLISINYTVTPENYMDLYETWRYFQDKPIDLFKFIHLNFLVDEIPIAIDDAVLHEQIQKIKNEKSKFPVYFFPELNKEELRKYYKEKYFIDRYKHCNVINTHCYIDFKGNVRPHVRCIDIIFGNIREQKFMDIWNGEKFREFRESVARQPLEECKRCCGITSDRTQG